jgi:hypothetical protein
MAMDPSTKRVLIILGVVILLLFALFILAAAFAPPGNASSGCTGDRRKQWRARLLGSESVGAGQLRGCTTTLGPFSLPQGQLCILRIAEADARSRQLVVETSQKMELLVHTNADGRKLTMKAEPKSGKPTEISFGKEEQRIDFICRDASPCQVRLR